MTEQEFFVSVAQKLEELRPGCTAEIGATDGKNSPVSPTLTLDETPIPLVFSATGYEKIVVGAGGVAKKISAHRYYVRVNAIHVTKGGGDALKIIAATATIILANEKALITLHGRKTNREFLKNAADATTAAVRGVTKFATSNGQEINVGKHNYWHAYGLWEKKGHVSLTANFSYQFAAPTTEEGRELLTKWVAEKQAELDTWPADLAALGLAPGEATTEDSPTVLEDDSE